MSAILYDDDLLTWSEQQSAALRKLAGRPGLSNAVDWENVIEEIESLGRHEFHAVESLLEQALVHLLKAYSDFGSLSRIAWGIETDEFLRQARKRFTNSMRRKLDLETIWQTAFKVSTRELTAYNVSPRPGIPRSCPFSLDDLLAETFTFDLGVAQLHERSDRHDET